MRIRTLRVLSSSRLGYRGAFLFCLSIIDVTYAWFLISPTPEQSANSDYVWRDHIMPSYAWGGIWLAAAGVLMICAFSRQDRIGYAIAIGLKVGWAFVAAAGGLTGNVQGSARSVAIWGGFAMLTVIASGWPEPMHSHEVTVIDEDPDRE